MLGVWVTWTNALGERVRGARRDSGAGFVEYAGLMILIAGIFVAIDQLGLDGKIGTAIGTAVGRVTGGG
ncbi:hypothetical protein OKJ99_21400 [Streptomyces endophyticus]|uniref:Flp family type IVb pilin n=1 Tax=Streptomyces endophyticus TaxID=714166 RepID=A0ABU6FB20_9ACTN|nr:hypothetical protein [Streptomyces endophyticus]MEB8340051.1 hypothetical protein [Streptomyces endophyticus]